MKVLLFAVLLGIAAARSHETKHVVYEAVVSTQAGMEGAGRLYKAVGLPECAAELNAVERDMKTKIGQALKDALDEMVNGFKDKVDKIKGLVQNVKDKLAEMKEKLRELGEKSKEKSQEAIDLVRKTVHGIIDNIVDSIQKKKENLDHQMDEVSKLKIQDLIKQLREKIVEKVQGIREYIKDIAVDNEAVKELKALLAKYNDVELADLINNILDLSGAEYRHLQDLFEKIKQIGAKSEGVLKEKIADLTGWVQTTWHDGLQKLVEKFRKIRSSLLEVISEAKDVSVEAARDAVKHLEKYKEELGDLYGKFVESLKKLIGKF